MLKKFLKSCTLFFFTVLIIFSYNSYATVHQMDRYIEAFIRKGISTIDSTGTIVVIDSTLQNILDKYSILGMGATTPEFNQADTMQWSEFGYYKISDYSKHYFFYLEFNTDYKNFIDDLATYPHTTTAYCNVEAFRLSTLPNEYPSTGLWWLDDQDYTPNFAKAWKYTTGHYDGVVTMVIMDDGIEYDSNSDFYNDSLSFTRILTDYSDYHYEVGQQHGYKVTSIVGALTNNDYKQASANWNSGIVVRDVWEGNNLFEEHRIRSRMSNAIQIDPNKRYLFNFSFCDDRYESQRDDRSPISNGMTQVFNHGGMSFCAMPNENMSNENIFPNYLSHTGIAMAVSGLNPDGTHYGQSGSQNTICAPAADLKVLTRTGSYNYATGNSYASPMVMGAASLLIEYDPSIVGEDAKYLLTSTATNLGQTSVPDHQFGYGALNIGLAMEKLAEHPIEHVYVNYDGSNVEVLSNNGYKYTKDIYIPDYYGPDHEIWPLNCASRGGLGVNHRHDFWQTYIDKGPSDPMHYTLKTYHKDNGDIITYDLYGNGSQFYAYSIWSPQVWRGEIRRDITWGSSTPVYLFDGLTIEDGATLTIEPGTEIKTLSSQGYICVKPGGKLIANGTSTDRIEFSSEDDSNWLNIFICEGADPLTSISYCDFQGRFAISDDPIIVVNGDINNSINNCNFYNAGRSIHTLYSNVDIVDCNFIQDIDERPANEYAISVLYPNYQTINGCSFQGYRIGIYAAGEVNFNENDLTYLFIEDNTFTFTEAEDYYITSAIGLRRDLIGIKVDQCVIDIRNNFFSSTQGFQNHSNRHAMKLIDCTGAIYRNHIEGFDIGVKMEGISLVRFSSNWFDNARYSVWSMDQSTPVFRSPQIGGCNRFETSDYSYTMGVRCNDIPIIDYGNNNFIIPSATNPHMFSVNYTSAPDPNPLQAGDYTFHKNYWLNSSTISPNSSYNGGIVRGYILNDLPDGTPNPWFTYANLYTLVDNASQEYYPMEGYLGGTTTGTPTPYFSLLNSTEQKFEAALDSMASGNYSYAAVKLQDSMHDSDDPSIRRASVNSLVACLQHEDLSSLGLSAIFTSLKDSTTDLTLKRRCQTALARIERVDNKSDQAILIFESIMDEANVSKIDSINAIRNAMAEYIYMAMQSSEAINDIELTAALANVSVTGASYTWLKPSSMSDYDTKCKELDDFLDPMVIKETTITDTIEWGVLGLVVLKNNITISPDAQLTILPGTTILGDDIVITVKGELICEGTQSDNIKFAPRFEESGVKIVFDSGSSPDSKIKYSIFEGSPVALDIQEQLTNPITDVTYNNCSIGVYCSNSSSKILKVTDCTFNSDGAFTDKGIQFFNGSAGSEIKDNNFFGAMRPVIVDNVNCIISGNYIENTDSLQTTAEVYGLEIHKLNGKVNDNTVINYPSGILLNDSDPLFFHNKIEGSTSEGLRLVMDSYPDMTNAGSGGMNYLKLNGASGVNSTQIRIDGTLYPNIKGGSNNLYASASSYAIMTNDLPKYQLNLEGNYWGDYTTVAASILNPYDKNLLNISPYLTAAVIPTGGYTTASTPVGLLAALQHISNSEFELAKPILEEIVFDSETVSVERLGCVSLLADCYLMAGEDSAPLRTDLIDLAAQTDDDDLTREALNTTARLNIEAGNYQDAIDHYTSIITDPETTTPDSLGAVMNSAYAYLRSQGESGVFEFAPDNGNSSVVKSEDKETSGMVLEDAIQPASVGEYMESVQDILAKLRGVEGRGAAASDSELPETFALHQNYPNPFNPSTTIRFDMPINADVKIAIYNVLGREVLTVLDTKMNAGAHSVNVDMQNFASGLYFYSIETANFKDVKKMLMIK